MAQRLRRRGLIMREVSFASGPSSSSMALSFVQLVKDGRLECYEDPEGRLRRDFGKFEIEYKPQQGYKLVAVSDEWGHADVGVALIMCLPEAVRLLGGYFNLGMDGPIMEVTSAEDDLTEKEIKDLPRDIRDLLESDPGQEQEVDDDVDNLDFDIV